MLRCLVVDNFLDNIKMTGIKSLKFNASYSRDFSFNPDDTGYLEYCDLNDEEPTLEGFKEFCREWIFDYLMSELYQFDITEVE